MAGMVNVVEDASDWRNVGENASEWAGGKERGQTDAERPCEAWRQGLLLGPLEGSEAGGARGTDGEETSGGGVARGGKGSGAGNGGGVGTRGIGWDGTRGGERWQQGHRRRRVAGGGMRQHPPGHFGDGRPVGLAVCGLVQEGGMPTWGEGGPG